MTAYHPNLTAASLYAIVRAVPREAWPHEIRRNGESAFSQLRFVTLIVGTPHHLALVGVDTAALAFIGSMTAWLLKETNALDIRTTPWGTVEVTTCGEESRREAPTLLEALALACKGAKQ